MRAQARRSRMWLSLIICAVLAFGIVGILTTLPAHAQQSAKPEIAATAAPRIVTEALARAGLRSISNLRQRGPNFTATVITPSGIPARVVVNAESGAILGLKLVLPDEEKSARLGQN